MRPQDYLNDTAFRQKKELRRQDESHDNHWLLEELLLQPRYRYTASGYDLKSMPSKSFRVAHVHKWFP